MDEDAVTLALQQAGILTMKGNASEASKREALKAHLAKLKLTVREVFDRIDEDRSGYLDKQEVERGAGMLGASLGFLMSQEMMSAAWRAMAPEDDLVSFDTFDKWWRGVEGGQLTLPGVARKGANRSDNEDVLQLSLELEEARRKIAELQGPTGQSDLAVLLEKQRDVEATVRMRDAGTALLFSAGGVELAKYTSKTPPVREVRFFCFTKKRDILWSKKPGGNGTVLKARKGDVQSIHHGMALAGRADEDIAQDAGWWSFHLLGQGRCFQFTVGDEDTFLKLYLAVHELLRQIALTQPEMETPSELGAAQLRRMVLVYKEKEALLGKEGFVVSLGGVDKGGIPSAFGDHSLSFYQLTGFPLS
jgi:hypothetical protein